MLAKRSGWVRSAVLVSLVLGLFSQVVTTSAQSSVYLPQVSEGSPAAQPETELPPTPEPEAEGEEAPVSAAAYNVVGNWSLTGRIGIGTDVPQHRLSILGGPAWTASFWRGALDLANGSAIGWRRNSTGWGFGLGHTDSGFHIFRTASLPATTGSVAPTDLLIDNSGRVGIGTLTPHPDARLEVANTPGSTAIRASGSFIGVHVANSANGLVVSEPSAYGVNVHSPGSDGVHVACPCGSLNYGVYVSNGNIYVSNGSFVDSGVTLNVPDYVFEPDYELLSLDEVRAYIATEQHLPNMPDAEQIQAGGLDLSAFQMKLLEKVEELTLYTLQQDERITALEQQNAELKAQRDQLAAQQEQLTDLAARLAALEGHE